MEVLTRREFLLAAWSFLAGGIMAYTLRTKDNALDEGRAADQNESVDNDIYFNTFGQWATWVPVVVGYSADPTDASYRYCQIGKLVICQMSELTPGTSDAVTCSYTLPVLAASATNNEEFSGRTYVCNDGVYEMGHWWIEDDAPTVVTVWRDGFAGWTASGDKLAFCHGTVIMYEAA